MTGIKLSSNFDLNSPLPLDSREVAETIVERDAIDGVRRYEGLKCFVKEEGKEYRLTGGLTNTHWEVERKGFLKQPTIPEGIEKGRLWLDTSDNKFQGTVLDGINEDVEELANQIAAIEFGDGIVQQDTPPKGIDEGRLWIDTSDNAYQGTIFEEISEDVTSLNKQLSDTATQLLDFSVNVLFPPPPLSPALRDNVSDDSLKINAIIEYVSQKGGGTVFAPNGTYFTGSDLIIKDNVCFTGDTNTIFDSKTSSSLIQVRTPSITHVDLVFTEDVKKGDRTIQVTNSLTVGDFVEIASTKRFTEEWDGGTEIRPYYTYGELLKVSSSTPNSITFTESVNFDFEVVDLLFFRGYTPTRNVCVKNIELIRDYSTKGAGSGVVISQVDNFELLNINTEYTNSNGILVERSNFGTISFIRGLGGSHELGLNYLININTGAKNITVNKVHGDGFRHVTAAGGSRLTSMNNSLTRISGVNTTVTTIDTHANTLNYTYEDCQLDYGINISGKHHTIRNIKVRRGAFISAEGGVGNLFDNIVFDDCTQFRVTSQSAGVIGNVYNNVTINYSKYVIANGWGKGSRNVTLSNFKIAVRGVEGAVSSAEADSYFGVGAGVGLLVHENFTLENVTVEGFPTAVHFSGVGVTAHNLEFINCGWKSVISVYDSVMVFSSASDKSRVDGVKISCSNTNLDLNASRIGNFSTSDNTALTLMNISDGTNHNNIYNLGFIGGAGYNIFMQNVRPSVVQPSANFAAAGKFIYNTIVSDN